MLNLVKKKSIFSSILIVFILFILDLLFTLSLYSITNNDNLSNIISSLLLIILILYFNKEYIFNTDMNDEDNFKTLEQFDYVLGKYLDDYEFRKELKKEIVRVKVVKSSLNIIKSIVVSINKIFDNYVESSTRVIRISRWI